MKRMSLATESQQARGWLSLKTAAGYLDMSPDALRHALECRAVRTPSDDIEANIEGVRSEKLGRFLSIPSSERRLATEGT
ncbi:hypothetical protein [Sorangium sp. So ce388]|uniref:hypothetical protein n=1 Tax=Sorangium sp. So ce388 TaxID=3133309 RepID=UPI003F5B233E